MRVSILTELMFVACDVSSETSFSIDFGRLRTVKRKPLGIEDHVRTSLIRRRYPILRDRGTYRSDSKI